VLGEVLIKQNLGNNDDEAWKNIVYNDVVIMLSTNIMIQSGDWENVKNWIKFWRSWLKLLATSLVKVDLIGTEPDTKIQLIMKMYEMSMLM